MKIRSIILLIAALFALSLAGFAAADTPVPEKEEPSPTGNAVVDKMLSALNLEKAPTVGNVIRKYFIAICTADWGTMWDIMADNHREKIKENWEAQKKFNFDEEIKKAKGQLLQSQNEKLSQYLKREIRKMEKTGKWLPGVKDARSYFIALQSMNAEIKFIALGEEFAEDGKTGWIQMRDADDKSAKPVKGAVFAKENGKWKLKDLGRCLPSVFGGSNVLKALDKVGLEKAPALGVVVRQYYVAQLKGDWATKWNLMAANMREIWEEKWNELSEKAVANLEKRIQDAKDDEKDELREELAELIEEREELSDVKDARTYFIHTLDAQNECSETVVGEEISNDGKTAWILVKNTKEKDAKPRKFTELAKQDGTWRIVKFGG